MDGMPNPVDATLTALSDPTRRRVVELLADRSLRADEIAALAGTSRPAIVRHLHALRNSELVDVEPAPGDARVNTYRLRPERFLALQEWLAQLHAYWTGQLTGAQSGD
jgi:DNA-binding transcriptional ArsR family regulator